MVTKNTGFHLIELLAVVSIVAIISLIAVPNILFSYQATLALQTAHRLHNTFNTARLGALQTRTTVTVCPLHNDECHTDWDQGWAIFIDPNGNKRLDVDEQPKYQLVSQFVTIAFRNRKSRYIHFLPTGTSNFTSLYLCGVRHKRAYYRVVINRAGRARIETSDQHDIC